MKTILTSALIIATLSGAAFAATPVSGVSAGEAQLALAAGVEPGSLSKADLLALIEAKRDNDSAATAFYLSGANQSSNVGNDNAGAAQLALSLGVEPGRFTTAELLEIQDAKRENDQFRINAILSGATRDSGDRGVTAGKVQLAALVGVNAADYTLAELIAMQRVPDSAPAN